MKGFVNICKPTGMTSSDVVVKVRGILRQAIGEKQKTGHLGTLDPLASGVLPVAVGNATRLFDYMLEKTKTYIATFKFGASSETLDAGSELYFDSNCFNKIFQEEEILTIIPQFLGEIQQIPPQYSAKSVNGRKAYDIAREGGFVNLQPKKVNIYDIKLIGIPHQLSNSGIEKLDFLLGENEFAFKITCGSGTYIRSLARDMGHALGTIGYMTSLFRTQVGSFLYEEAITLEEFQKAPLDFVIPIDFALKSYDVLDLDENQGAKALNGVKIACEMQKSPFVVRVCGELVGLGEVEQGCLRIKTRL